MNKITGVKARLFNVPLDEVLTDAKHGAHSHFHLITATITLSDGRSATGYTYNGGRGGVATAAVITHDLADLLIGEDAGDVEGLYQKMQWHLHYVGRGGIVSFAISAIDIALWDLRAKAAAIPLWKITGGASDRCQAYAGGIDLGFALPKLLASVEGYLAAGFNAVKIKIGQPDMADDVARIRAVRALIGPDVTFMIDANYALSVAEAIALGNAVKDQDIYWFEEPVIPAGMRGFRKAQVLLWRRVKTCTPFMNLKWLWPSQNWALSSQMPRIAVALLAGSKWPVTVRWPACPCAVTECRNCMSVWSVVRPMVVGSRCTASRLTAIRRDLW